MLVFDRPNFKSGITVVEYPEIKIVEEPILNGKSEPIRGPEGLFVTKKVKKEFMVKHELTPASLGKEFVFPKEDYLLKKYPTFWRGTPEWQAHHDKKKERERLSAERKKEQLKQEALEREQQKKDQVAAEKERIKMEIQLKEEMRAELRAEILEELRKEGSI